MATRTVGAKVVLDGEKEYKQALSELNTGNRTLATEMKKLQAEFKGNADSTEALTRKGDLLQRQLLQQQDKVQLLRDAVRDAAEKYGEAGDQTQKYMQQLNMAEAAVFDLEHAIDENTEALNSNGEEIVDETGKMKGLGDTVQDLAGKLGIQLPKGATTALNGMSKLSTGTVAAMGAAVVAVKALIDTVKALQKETIEAAARADDILTKSTTMGIGAGQYQALQYASPLVDVDVDTMAASLAKLTQAMADAQAGGESTSAMFRNLGVEIRDTDGHLRNSYDVWLDVMDALSNMGNATEQDAAAMELLGKKAQDFAPIYREGTEALREYTAAAEENYVMSDEQLAVLGEVDDAWQKLQLDIEANKNMIGVQWAPTAKQALESFDRLVTAAGKALTDSGIIKGFGEIVQYALRLLDPIADLLNAADSAPGRLSPVYEILHGIAGVFAWIADAGQVVAGILQTLTVVGAPAGLKRIGTAMGFGASSGNYSNMQQWMGMGDTTGNYYNSETGRWTGNYGYNATGNDFWRGGLTWAGEAGPELVQLPAGSRIYSAQESRQLAGGDTFYITFDTKNVKEFNDIVNLAKSAKVRSRMRGVTDKWHSRQ